MWATPVRVTAAVAALSLAACGSDDAAPASTTSSSTTRPAPPTTAAPTTTTPRCPEVDTPAAATSVSDADGDVDGDGQTDRLHSYRLDPEWHLQVELAAGGGADVVVETFGAGAVAVLGGADVNGDGRQEVWARTGSGASAAIVGSFVFADCTLTRTTFEGGGVADFAVGGSVGSAAGAECRARVDPTAHLTSYSAHTGDGRDYEVTATELALTGSVFAPRGTSTATVSVDDPAFARATRFECGDLRL